MFIDQFSTVKVLRDKYQQTWIPYLATLQARLNGAD